MFLSKAFGSRKQCKCNTFAQFCLSDIFSCRQEDLTNYILLRSGLMLPTFKYWLKTNKTHPVHGDEWPQRKCGFV